MMAKARIGHFAEAQVLEALEVDYIDESEVLTPADEANHIDKWAFKVPFVCGATNLGEALRRIGEGAAMIRSKGEAGTGDIVEAVRHLRRIGSEIRRLQSLDDMELATAAKEHQAPLDLVRGVAEAGKLPVVLFCAGGIATPADASLVMQLGAEGVFVGSGIFKSEDPATRAAAIVEATTHFRDADRVAARQRGPRPGDGVAGVAQARGAAAPRQPRLVSAPLVGVLALQGDFEAHARVLRGLGAEVREVRVPADLDGPRRPGDPRRRVDDDDARDRARGARRAAARAGPLRHAGARHLRGDDHARPRAPRARRLHAAGATRSAARSARSRPTSRSPASTATPVRAVFIRAPWIDEHGDARRGARRGRRPRRRRAPGQHARDLLPPRDRGRDAPARAVPAGRRA